VVIFKYGQTEIDHLSQRDPMLGKAIATIGMIERELYPDLFAALIRNIVAQQISKQAAATVWNRIVAAFGVVTPAKIAAADIATIQQLGLSLRKAGYIKHAAEAVIDGQICLEKLPHLSDEQVIAQLTQLPGVGVWTAEMLLLFSLARPDVLSWGDQALRRGLRNLYGLEDLTKDQFYRYKKRYSPYSSVASLYLWELA